MNEDKVESHEFRKLVLIYFTLQVFFLIKRVLEEHLNIRLLILVLPILSIFHSFFELFFLRDIILLGLVLYQFNRLPILQPKRYDSLSVVVLIIIMIFSFFFILITIFIEKILRLSLLIESSLLTHNNMFSLINIELEIAYLNIFILLLVFFFLRIVKLEI